MISNGFIVNPDSRLLPTYRISPFDNHAALINRGLSDNFAFDQYFTKRFKAYNWGYTLSGRSALKLALDSLKLSKSDTITILTTSSNFYISSCVTSQIEDFCLWNRSINDQTKAILVNHEFGFPFEDLRGLKKYGLPIIEDCAHSFLSQNEENSVGSVGDFLIFSLPKYFPIQIGGIFCSHEPISNKIVALPAEEMHYIRNALGYYLPSISQFAFDRRKNFDYYTSLFSANGYLPRFEMKTHHIPGVYIFKLFDYQDGQGLKDHLWKNGIESSVFYKENSVYIPVHHRLNQGDMDCMYEITSKFLNQ